MPSSRPVRTRFAPSPTGFLHVGNLRTALYAYLLAKQHDGQFIVRIEDTDQERKVPGSVHHLLEILDIAGIVPDEGPVLSDQEDEAEDAISERGDYGPYTQSKRLNLYQDYAQQLVNKGAAYRCFCTRERLEQMREEQQKAKQPPRYDRTCLSLSQEEIDQHLADTTPHVIRLRMPEGKTIAWEDAVRGHVEFSSDVIDDQVLLKSDGFPTYHLAVVVDDHHMEISHVIRGEEWLSSTPKHLVLYKAFGWEPPIHVHVPLLLNADKSKLSKRQGSVAVGDFLDEGYLPECLVNFIALLGWNPKSEQELFSLEQLIEAFSLEGLHKGGAVFDREKLTWMNKEYVQSYAASDLLLYALPFYEEKGLIEEMAKRLGASNKLDTVVMNALTESLSIEQSRLETLADVGEETRYLFVDQITYERDDLVWKKSTPEDTQTYLEALHTLLEQRPEDLWTTEQLEQDLIAWIAEQNWKNGDVLWPLRVSLTGEKRSPGPFESLWALGKERSLARIASARQMW